LPIPGWKFRQNINFLLNPLPPRVNELRKPAALEFGACSKKAQTVPRHARCLSALLKNEFTGTALEQRVGHVNNFIQFKLNMLFLGNGANPTLPTIPDEKQRRSSARR
jgi:hypothetical protein